MPNKEEYLRVAKEAGTFKLREMKDLSDMLDEFFLHPNIDYHVLDLRDPFLVGFTIFGRSPMSTKTWDIYWLSVSNVHKGKGYGKRLVNATEHMIKKLSPPNPIIRIETSSKKPYDPARALYKSLGYSICGILDDFFCTNDNLITFYKRL